MLSPVQFGARLQIPLPEEVATKLDFNLLPDEEKPYVRLDEDRFLRVITASESDRENMGLVKDLLDHLTGWVSFLQDREAEIEEMATGRALELAGPQPEKHDYDGYTSDSWYSWQDRLHNLKPKAREEIEAELGNNPEYEAAHALARKAEEAVDEAFFTDPLLKLDSGWQG